MTGIFYVCGNTGVADTEIRVSTESRPWRRKFSRRSSRDSNPRPFNHESGALTTELSPPPERITMTYCGYLYVTSSTRDTETKRQSTYRGSKWFVYYENNILRLQIENYTCSTIRLWLSCFICDNKHTFVSRCHQIYPCCLLFLLQTVDWLDNVYRNVLRVKANIKGTSPCRVG